MGKARKNYETRKINLNRMEEIQGIKDTKQRVWQAALEYSYMGIHVVPLMPNTKSLPYRDYNFTYAMASAKKATVDKWFHPTNGKFAGFNIGIATGKENGVFAIDIDVHGDENGFQVLEELIKDHGPIEGPQQRTPSGGMHILLNWQDNAVSSTGKIAPSIDTRGGNKDCCKGHIVAFPSQIDGKGYKWESGGDIQEIPPWIMEKLGVSWKPSTRFTRGNENVTGDDIEQEVPIDQIKRMLDAIDPNELSYDEWLRVGLAIKSQYPGDDGLKMWDKWSSDGDRYRPQECIQRWHGFSDNGTVRMGSLFYYAEEAGWKPDKKKKDVKGNKHDILVEQINNEYAIVVTGGKIRILREKSEIIDPVIGHYDLMSKDDFRTLMQNEVIFVENAKGEAKPICIADIWLAHSSRRTYPNGIGLFPDEETLPQGWYNTWRGFSVTPRKGNCKLFLKHIKEVICNGNEGHYDWILDWCADAVQDPANPKGTAVVLRGDEGAGKGTIANTIGELFGPHFRHLIDDTHLLSNFNAHMIDALFVFADEITWGGNKKTAGKLKGMVTEKFLVGERKGVDAVGYRNMTRMIIASNSDWVIPAGPNSRRWFVLDVNEERCGDRSYFNDLEDELNNGGKEALLYFLLNREIKSDLRQALTTDALIDQRHRSNTHSTTLQWWTQMTEFGEIDAESVEEWDNGWPKFITKQELFQAYERWCVDRKVNATQIYVFYKEVLDFGIKPIKITLENKKRIAVYEIDRLDKCKVRARQLNGGR